LALGKVRKRVARYSQVSGRNRGSPKESFRVSFSQLNPDRDRGPAGAVEDRRRNALRDAPSALRTRFNDGDQQSAIPGMDRRPLIGATDRRFAQPAHPRSKHPGDECRPLPPQAEPPQTAPILRALNLTPHTRQPYTYLPACFCSAPVAWIHSVWKVRSRAAHCVPNGLVVPGAARLAVLSKSRVRLDFSAVVYSPESFMR